MAVSKKDPFESTPFDTAPETDSVPSGDEAQAEVANLKVDTKANPLIVSPEGKVTVTLKGGTGFDSPWVVIHGSDVDNALDQLSEANLPALLEKAQKASEFFSGKKATPAAPAAPAAVSGRPAAASAGQGGVVRTCVHGQMVARSGVKNGRAWSGHFCPTPQNTPDQCAPQFDK